jgi:hypothetical protein
MLLVSLMKGCLLLRSHAFSILGVLLLVGLLGVLSHYMPVFLFIEVFFVGAFFTSFLIILPL